MNSGTELILGIFLILLGAILWFSVHLLLKRLAGDRLAVLPIENSETEDLNKTKDEAIIKVQTGGRLVSLNNKARQLFGLQKGSSSNLNSLAKLFLNPESFLRVCSQPDEEQLSLRGENYTAVSYATTGGVLVVLRPLMENDGPTQLPEKLKDLRMLELVSEISASLSTSLELDTIIRNFISHLPEIVPAERFELKIWDDDADFLIPYCLFVTGEDKKIIIGKRIEKFAAGFSGKILQTNQIVWIDDLSKTKLAKPESNGDDGEYRSFLGFPLLFDHEVLGTLEFYGLKTGSFTEDQKAIIEKLIPLLASAINNAALFKVEKQRASELNTLAQLARSTNQSRKLEENFEHMLNTIAPLVAVEMIGFLLFNASQQMLEAQTPFIGLPAPFVEIFKTTITHGGNAEKLLFSQDVLITENAEADLHWITLGLDPIARAASIHEAVLIPLISAGRVLGFLMAANHSEVGQSFSQLEMHLLMIVANQAAPLIENLLLIKESRQKANRADVLRQIAVFSQSNTNLTEVFRFSLEHLIRFFDADCGATFLLNQDRSVLGLDMDSLYGCSLPEDLQSTLSLSNNEYPFTITNTQKAMVYGKFDETDPVVPFYQKFIDNWKLASVMMVPMILHGEGIGEIWIGSRKPNSYDFGDIQNILPAVEQLAVVVEQSLPQDEKDLNVQKKLDNLTSLSNVSRDVLQSKDLSEALDRFSHEAKRVSHADQYVSIILSCPRNSAEQAQILALSGNYLTSELNQLKDYCLGMSAPENRSIEDTMLESFFPGETKSWLEFPLSLGTGAIGGLCIFNFHSHLPGQNQFEQVDTLIHQVQPSLRMVCEGFLWQRDIEIQEKKLELQNRGFAISQRCARETPLLTVLEEITVELQDLYPFSAVGIYEYKPEVQNYQRIVRLEEGDCDCLGSKTDEMSWEAVELSLNPANRFNNFYFSAGLDENQSEKERKADGYVRYLYPIRNFDTQPIGLVSLIVERGENLSGKILEFAEIFVQQIAILLESHQLKRREGLSMGNTMDTNAARQNEMQDLAVSDQSDLDWKGFDRLFSGSQMTAFLENPDLGFLAKKITEFTSFTKIAVFSRDLNGVVKLNLSPLIGMDPNQLQSALGQDTLIDGLFRDPQLTIYLMDGSGSNADFPAIIKSIGSGCYLFFPLQIESDNTSIWMLASDIENAIPTQIILEKIEKNLQFLQYGLRFKKNHIENLQELSKLRELYDFFHQIDSLDQATVLERLLERSLKDISIARAGWVGLWDESEQTIKPTLARGYKNCNALLRIRFSPQVWAIPSIVLENQKSISINELNFSSNYPLSTEDLVHYQSASGGLLPTGNLLIPLIHQDQSLGILVLENFDSTKKFEASDETWLNLLAGEASKALNRAMQFYRSAAENQELDDERYQLKQRLQILSSLTTTPDHVANLDRALSEIRIAVGAEFALILSTSGSQIYMNDSSDNTFNEKRDFSSIANKLKDIREPAIVDEMYKRDEWLELIGQDFPYSSMLITPLPYGHSRNGVVLLGQSDPFHFTAANMDLVQSLAGYLSNALYQIDLSEMVENQQMLLRTGEDQQAETISKSQAVLDAMSDGIILVDAENRITFVNQASENVLGLPFGHLSKAPMEEFANDLQKVLAPWKKTLTAWASNPILLNIDRQYSERLNLPGQRIISVHAAPILWEGEYLGAVTHLRDMTVEAQIDGIKSDFIANVSHELRTPLTSIKGYADVMLMGAAGQISDQQKRFLSIIKNNASRLNILVDDLLDMAHIDREATKFDFRAVYLEKILNQQISELQNQANEDQKKLNVEMKIPRNMKPVRADAKRIEQVLKILLQNSYLYSSANIQVIIRVSQSRETTQIDVQDFGIGIKKLYQDQIFERFYRGDDAQIQAVPGTGLGLAVAKSLVEMHGGQIWFYSSGVENEGAIFSFTIPVYEAGIS